MGAVQPDYPATLSGIQDIREKPNDPAVDVWIQAGGTDWFRLIQAGTIHCGSKYGTSF